MSLYAGMPWPPSSTRERMLASVGFVPLVILSRLNRPLRPGPIFLSSESALWHTAHCSKTSLPLAASPLPADITTREAVASRTQVANTRNRNIGSILSVGTNFLFYNAQGEVRRAWSRGSRQCRCEFALISFYDQDRKSV